MTAGARDFKRAFCLLLTLYVRKVKSRIGDGGMQRFFAVANRLYNAFARQMRDEGADVTDGIDLYSVYIGCLDGVFRRIKHAVHICVPCGDTH